METEKLNTSTEVVETSSADTGGQAEEEKKSFQSWFKSLFIDDKVAEGKETKDEKADKDLKKSESKDEKKSKADELSFDERLKEERKKWEEEAKKKSEFEKLPADEQAKLKEAEREEKIKQLETELLKKELKDKAITSLSEDGYPVKLAELLNYSNEDDMKKSLETVTGLFKETLAEAVNEKLKGKTPEGLGSAAGAENALRDEISKSVRGGI